MRKGYEKFREWMLEYTELDIDHYVTIQSLCGAYKLKVGCYDGVAMVSGIVQDYIARCIVGGRCMTNSNTMYRVKRKLSDFDARSLYSSAMPRMKGYLKGEPHIVKELTHDFLEKQSGYFVKIRVTKVGKQRQFPLLSKHAENGVRIFTNEMVGEIVYIDKTSLEDAITFQEIEFEVIDGYFFNAGWNDTINHVIEHLYEKRRALNREKTQGRLL